MQPAIQTIKTKTRSIRAFKGLCLRETAPEGYFADAENLSSAEYPAVSARAARRVIADCANVTAMFNHAKMCWLDGTDFYYGSACVGSLTAGEKRFACLGAHVAVYPDKKILNTETLALADMECTVTRTGVSASSCGLDGTDAENTEYAKIAAAGIGAGFSKGDGVTISGFSNAALNGAFVLQAAGNDELVIVCALSQAVSGEASVTVSRLAPDLDFVLALDNRVWGASSANHAVYACKLGDMTNWNVFEGLSTDAYAVSVASPGDFTGCAQFLGSALFFKENEILKLFGTKPSNFQLLSSEMPGVESGASGSIAHADSVLYYKGIAGVYAYDGSTPQLISQALGARRFSGAAAGALDGRVYFSMYDARLSRWQMLVYYADTGIWQRESAPRALYFAKRGGALYFGGADGKVYGIRAPGLWFDPAGAPNTRLALLEGSVPWYLETGPLALITHHRQYLARLHLRFSAAAGAQVTVKVKYTNDGVWRQAGTVTCADAREETHLTLPLCARRADGAYVRVSGTGGAAITALSLIYETGSDSA